MLNAMYFFLLQGYYVTIYIYMNKYNNRSDKIKWKWLLFCVHCKGISIYGV